MENGKWTMVNGQWTMENGPQRSRLSGAEVIACEYRTKQKGPRVESLLLLRDRLLLADAASHCVVHYPILADVEFAVKEELGS